MVSTVPPLKPSSAPSKKMKERFVNELMVIKISEEILTSGNPTRCLEWVDQNLDLKVEQKSSLRTRVTTALEESARPPHA